MISAASHRLDATREPPRRHGRGTWARRGLILATFAVSLPVCLTLLQRADRVPGIDPRLCRLVAQLEARESFYQRVVCRGLHRVAPGMATHFPRLFTTDTARTDRRRLAAHEALLALGDQARPALPLLARTLSSTEPMVRTYALVVVAHLKPDEQVFMRLIENASDHPERAIRHLRGVLNDEDEQLRDFARRCLSQAQPMPAPEPQSPWTFP